MSKKEITSNRLDELFSGTEAPSSEPDEASQAVTMELLDEVEPQSGMVDPSKLDGRQKRVGWDDYLNAIDRSEEVNLTFDRISGDIYPSDEVSPDEGVLATPLKIGDEVLGMLKLEGAEEWSEDETALLSSIAGQVSQHIENLRLLAQAEQYRAEAEQATRRLTHEGWDEYMQSPLAPARGYVYDQKKVHEASSDTELMMDENDQVVIQNLLVRDQLIGQIAVDATQVDEEEISVLVTTISERLSAHIENLRLLDETEFGRQQLDKRATELETVAQVSTAAATILDPQALLQSVVDLTQYSFGLYYLNVYLFSKDGQSLEFAAGTGNAGRELLAKGHSIQLDQAKSIIAKAARTREVVIVTDARTDPEFLHHQLLPDTLSEMALPMIVADELIGIFDVEDDQIDRFKEDDIRTFSTLATQTGVALRNAQLYAEQMATVERLRELDELKSSFLANMSHELRTPLNSILGFTQVILEGLDGPLTEDMETDLGLIHNSGQHLLALINDVLDMAKIESGKLSLSLEPIDIGEMLKNVIQTIEPLAKNRTLSLDMKSTLTPGKTIMADSLRLRQILMNLMGNSIKFTEKGGVSVEIQQIEKNILIKIKDTGIGIPPEKVDSIFEAFSQVDTSSTRKAGGTGLGLPISRRLVEVHGGRLWAESKGISGKGSVFHLELPIETELEMANE